MKPFEHAYNVLLKVIEEQIPFNLAIKATLKNEKQKYGQDLKADISASSGCALRHYYVFKEIVNRKYPDIKENQFLLIALGLGDHIFAHRFDEEELFAYIEKNSEVEGVVDFIKSYSDPKALIPEDVPFDSKKYISLRHNLPIWIVNMWQKNAGKLAGKLFRYYSQSKKTLVRINSNAISDEEFFNKHPEFSAFSTPNIAVLNEKGNIRKNPAITSGEAIYMPGGYHFMLEDLDVDVLRGIAIYGASNNYLLEELYARLGSSFKADYVCGLQSHFFDTDKKVKNYSLNNVSLYEGDHTLIITCISKPVHTFFVCPENSYLVGLSERPDYFLSIKQDDLDRLIDGEYKSLEEASIHVEDGGDLVYFVPTFCRNEGNGLIQRFLKNHPDFTLVKEKQLFPFDRYQTFLYFAVLRKEEKHD